MNFINITEREKDKPIFRVISSKRLFEIFKTNKIVLVKPRLWDDPFENFIMNATGELSDGTMFSNEMREHFYGQCWTKTRESDAMWRIYSPEKDGVRITSTPRKLLNSLYNSPVKSKNLSCFIGKVEYFTTKNLKTYLNNNGSDLVTDTTGFGQASTLLFKRTPFKHENEVRLIYNNQESSDSDYFSLTVDPFDLIDDIVFDPRMDYKIFIKLKTNLKQMGYKKRIVKSVLYNGPSWTFRFNK